MRQVNAALLVFAVLPVCASTNLTFKSVSIRPGIPKPRLRDFAYEVAGGPGSGPLKYTDVPMRELLLNAYGLVLSPFQLSAPEWVESQKYDITARLPWHATRQQIPMMLRNMLKDRFGLEAHHETREFTATTSSSPTAGRSLRHPHPPYRAHRSVHTACSSRCPIRPL